MILSIIIAISYTSILSSTLSYIVYKEFFNFNNQSPLIEANS